MKLATIHFVLLFFIFINPCQSKAIMQNGNLTMRYYVFPMEDWEVEALQRQSRQQQGTNPSNTGNTENDGALPLAGTATNVVNILNGLFNQDVRPILVGSTAFIPEGNLREGVSGLLLGLAPNIQHILFGSSRLPPSYSTIMTRQPLPRPQPPLNPPRPQLIIHTTSIPESPPVAVTVAAVVQTPAPTPAPTLTPTRTPEDISEEETESPRTAPPLPPPTSARPSTTTSAESEEDPEAPVAALSTIAPTPDPSEAIDSETEIVPEPTSTNVPKTVPTTTTKPATPTVAELKVVLEDTNSNSIITANVASNSTDDAKQYFYLVLLPEEYDQLTKLEGLAKTPKPQENLESEGEILVQQPTTEILSSSPSTIVNRTSRPRNRNRNRTRTTSIPPPHLQLNYYYQMTSTSASTTTTTSTTTTYKLTSSTDLPGVQGFQNEDDEFEPKITIY